MDSCACRARHVAERLMCRHMRGVLLVYVIDVLLQDRGVAVCTVLLHGGVAVCTALAEAVATAATSASRSSASMRASAAEKRASTACVDVSSSKDRVSPPPCVEGRRSTHRLAPSNAHRRAARGWRPRLAGPPLTAPRPEVDGGEWRVASRADLCAEMPRGPHVGTEVCAEMPCGSHVGSEVPVGRPHDRSVFERP